MPIKINFKKCCWKGGKCSGCSCVSSKCKGCVEVCPVRAFKREATLVWDKERCIDCGACVDACRHGAISVV